jgi:hypothetical protein
MTAGDMITLPCYQKEADMSPCTIPEHSRAQSISVESVVTLLNRVDPLVSKLKLLSDLSPLVDDAPLEDKGRVAIGLLEIVADYVEQLEAVLILFSNRLPRPHAVEEDR